MEGNTREPNARARVGLGLAGKVFGPCQLSATR